MKQIMGIYTRHKTNKQVITELKKAIRGFKLLFDSPPLIVAFGDWYDVKGADSLHCQSRGFVISRVGRKYLTVCESNFLEDGGNAQDYQVLAKEDFLTYPTGATVITLLEIDWGERYLEGKPVYHDLEELGYVR